MLIILILGIISLPAAALPERGADADTISLTGQVLIASPETGDPRFKQTVVLLLRHNESGAVGIVVNRPIGERPLARIMEVIGEDPSGVEGSVPMFAGGPVSPDIGFVVHSEDYHRIETLQIGQHLAMTSTREILSDIAHKKGPKKFLIAFGYAGWGPGQLEVEIAQHGWFTAPADSDLIFDENRGTLWEEAMKRRKRQL